MISKLLKFVKKNSLQVVLLFFIASYFFVYAYTGSCPMQLVGDRLSGSDATPALMGKEGVIRLEEVASTISLLDGTEMDVSELNGKVTVINYWATWCGPCLKEIPAFNKIAKEKSDEVQFIGISLDKDGSAVDRFLKRTPVDYPLAHGDLRFSQITGPIRSIPTTLFFNSEGKYAGKVVGTMSEKQLLRKIESL